MWKTLGSHQATTSAFDRFRHFGTLNCRSVKWLRACTAHGLKKPAATICAELGATDRQMMALFDWTSESMATPYTRTGNKVKLAASAAAALGSFSWDALANWPRKAEVAPDAS